MPATADKPPKPGFLVRLVGAEVRPWAVPLRTLSRLLDAVQRLIDQREDEDEPTDVAPSGVAEARHTLHLVGVTAGSAAYQVHGADPENALGVLGRVAEWIAAPSEADWSEAALSAIEELSATARALRCEIEFRRNARSGVIAKITPDTYQAVSVGAFVDGQTSVYAKVERIGGATEMRCGIRLPASSRKMVICTVANEELARALGQHLYEHVMLSGEARWLRHNWQLKRLHITSFAESKTGPILSVLQRVRECGGHVWDDIEDPAAYLAEVRGE